MNSKLKSIKNMMSLEDQLQSEVLKTVGDFLKDNDNQKVTKWNSLALIATLKNGMKRTVEEYYNKKNQEKDLCNEKEVIK